MSDWSVRSGVAVRPSRNCGREVRQQPPIGGGGGVVELVDHDVVEVLRREPLRCAACPRVCTEAQRRSTWVSRICAHVETQPERGPDAKKGLRSLNQDLFAVGDEQHPARPHLLGVEGGQIGLAQAGGHDHQAAPVSGRPCCRQRGQRLDLDGRGLGRRLVLVAARATARGGGTPALLVASIQASVSCHRASDGRTTASNRRRASRNPSSPG